MDRALRIYLWLAFGITWGAGGLALLAGAYRPDWALSASHPLYYVAAFGPSLAGLIMVGRAEGRAGLRCLLARAVPSRAGWPWYLAVIVGFPAVALLAGRLVVPDILTNLPRWDRLLPLLALTLVTDPGPLGEELGWRGFALPRLLRRWPPLAASLTLGVVWTAWHLPTFVIPTLSQSQLSIPVFLLGTTALSIIMTWLHLRSRGDLLLMILVHLMSNYCAGSLGVPFNALAGAEVVCAALIVAAGGLRAEARPGDGAADAGAGRSGGG